jgi:hypothetical protein
MKQPRLLYGVGINDYEYKVSASEIVNGKSKITWVCHYYSTWSGMLERCYSKKYQLYRPSYQGCSVCPEWIHFSVFRAWMVEQSWAGLNLDKDILIPGNKMYSPEACAFVSAMTNNFLISREACRGDYPIGVSLRRKKFVARCRNPFTKKVEHLGHFTCPNKAHEAWRTRKHELAIELAKMQSDKRVANALINRFKPQPLTTGQ